MRIRKKKINTDEMFFYQYGINGVFIGKHGYVMQRVVNEITLKEIPKHKNRKLSLKWDQRLKGERRMHRTHKPASIDYMKETMPKKDYTKSNDYLKYFIYA